MSDDYKDRIASESFGRGFGWKPDLPSIKDWPLRMSAVGRNTAVLPPVSPDRREINPPVRDQGKYGSCVGCSSVYGVAWLRRHEPRDLEGKTIMSAMQEYYDARTADGDEWKNVDAGAYIRDAMDMLRKKGVAPESNWPYTKPFNRTPTKSVYTAAARWKLGAHWRCNGLDDILQAINAGYAVVGGITIYSSFWVSNTNGGRVPMPNAQTDKLEGGHALYWDMFNQAERWVRFENSWGPNWGDRGYGYVPFDYLANPNLADDFWAMQSEAPETTPWRD
jgi:C1A family cysteine protease